MAPCEREHSADGTRQTHGRTQARRGPAPGAEEGLATHILQPRLPWSCPVGRQRRQCPGRTAGALAAQGVCFNGLGREQIRSMR